MSDEQKTTSQKGARRSLKLNPAGDEYWLALPDGRKNEVFADLIDMAIPLDRSGLTDPRAIQAVIDDGIFNLYSVLSNPGTTVQVQKAMRWAIAKVVLGDEIELIKAGSILIGSKPLPDTKEESVASDHDEPTTKQEAALKLMPKGKVAPFLL
ncbi:MAG: hypothetical protein RPS47_04595 [Colwellia sp.]|jgi:hypothetical protein